MSSENFARTHTPERAPRVAIAVERGNILLPNECPSVSSKLKRRFYHLGVERHDMPPRDAESLSDPEGFCAFIQPPPTAGLDPAIEARRAIEYNAHGAPPPRPKYFNDVDRCRHFVHGRGGADVAAHFINRPSYQLSTGDYPLSSHPYTMLKEMLSLNAVELNSMLRQPRGANSSPSSPSPARLCPLRTTSQSTQRSTSGSSSPAVLSPDLSMPCRYSPSGTHDGRASSIEVARRSSSLNATREVRRFNQLLQRGKLLKHLQRMGHPNQVSVYLPGE